MIDIKDLKSGDYAKWLGHLTPDVIVAVLTAGGGGAAAVAGEGVAKTAAETTAEQVAKTVAEDAARTAAGEDAAKTAARAATETSGQEAGTAATEGAADAPAAERSAADWVAGAGEPTSLPPGGGLSGVEPPGGGLFPGEAPAAGAAGQPAVEVEAAARDLLSRAQAAEPRVTSDLQELAREQGAQLEGLQHRLKSLDSLTRKISTEMTFEGKTAGEVTTEINDSLRYTMTTSGGQFVSTARRVLAKLDSEGYIIQKVKNTWVDGNSYKGVNVEMTGPDGHLFELQFHTPESYALKQATHAQYEEFRLDTTPLDRKISLYDEMSGQSAHLQHPPGIDELGSLRRYPRPGAQ
jgi:hypothetical protein